MSRLRVEQRIILVGIEKQHIYVFPGSLGTPVGLSEFDHALGNTQAIILIFFV